ncbi:MAG TPA: hypothetical protein VIU82_01840 [Bosea sp. (in: a-proteobacteria)]
MSQFVIRLPGVSVERELQRREKARIAAIEYNRTRPSCEATTRAGSPCRQPVRRGQAHCRLHGDRRSRPLPDIELSPDQLARRQRGRLNTKWLKNPWLEGATIALSSDHDARIEAEAGVSLDELAPGVRDWLRWRFATRLLRWKDLPRWQEALVELRAKIQWSIEVRRLLDAAAHDAGAGS